MGEFIRFLVVSNLSLVLVWLSYILLLNRNTFHGLNRAYLLVGSLLALIVPLLPLGVGATAERVFVMLPALEVGSNVVPSAGFSLPFNIYLIV